MIIGVCGFGSSGSSVVSDYLKEYDSIDVLDDFEYTICYCPDGIVSLDYALNTVSSRNDYSSAALDRFEYLVKKKLVNSSFVKQSGIKKKDFLKICDSYIAKLTSFSWKGYNGTEFITKSKFYKIFGISIMMQRIVPFFEKKLKKTWKGKYPYHDIRLCVEPDGFYEATKTFNSEIIQSLGYDTTKMVVLDQPFSGDKPDLYMDYFDNPMCILVDRDPRDTYIFLKTKLKNRGSFMPSDTVQHFIEYYRKIRKYRKLYEHNQNQRILFIRFEDMVYKYESTVLKIQQFLSLGENPNPQTIFIPKKSMANTQLFKRFPQFEGDIRIIEQELSEFLYDFSNCPAPNPNDEMFFGKSSINLKNGKK